VINVRINPTGVENEYLGCLNTCFPGWGDERTFNWYFRRETAWPRADLIAFEDEGRMVAGSAVTYRSVALANGATVKVGIMTGSWTLPDVRRQGFFTRMIEESNRLAAQKNSALLLAFVKANNPSCRRLAQAGASLFPAWYLSSKSESQTGLSDAAIMRVSQSEPTLDALVERRIGLTKNSSHFAYPSAADFKSQFLERPGGSINILRDQQDNLSVVESSGDADVLQLFLPTPEFRDVLKALATMVASAASRKRRFLFFSSDPIAADLAPQLGLSCEPGYLATLVSDFGSLRGAFPENDGAPLEDTGLLTKPGSPWFLGPWQIAGGDRA
jgi:hypothetical protein